MDSENEKPPKTLKNEWWRVITIEPSIALFQVTTVMTNQLFNNLYLQKACRNNTSKEPDLHTPCDNEKAGQLFMTEINIWRYSVSITLMIIFTVLISSWSDKAGRRRRPLILIPLMGLVLVDLAGCIFSYFWSISPRHAVIAEVLLHGITGGRLTITFSAQLYICDITTEYNRTVRLGIIHGINIIAIPIGNGVIGFMMRNIGFFNSFLVVLMLSILAVILAVLLMTDHSVPVEEKISIWQTLNPTRVVESFQIIFKERAYSKRTIIILLLGIEALSLLPILGESSVLYLYLRYKFKWNEKDYSVYSMYKMTLVFIGTVFSTAILSKRFNIHDGIIGSISGVFNTAAAIFYIFACNEWMLYTAPVIDMLHGTGIAVVSSFVTKCLEKYETGHLMSVRCILQLLTPFCFPFYNFVYRRTMDYFPSAFFILSIVINIPSIFLFAFAYYLHTRTQVMNVSTQE